MFGSKSNLLLVSTADDTKPTLSDSVLPTKDPTTSSEGCGKEGVSEGCVKGEEEGGKAMEEVKEEVTVKQEVATKRGDDDEDFKPPKKRYKAQPATRKVGGTH